MRTSVSGCPFGSCGSWLAYVAEAHRLSMPSSYRLRLCCTDREPIPTVTVNEHGTLWVEPETSPMRLADEAVRYVYVTRSHAKDGNHQLRHPQERTGQTGQSAEAAAGDLEPVPNGAADDEPAEQPLLSVRQEVRRLPLPWDLDEKNFGKSRMSSRKVEFPVW